MDYDKDRVDEMTLALMCLGMSKELAGGKAWKGFDIGAIDRLHKKGWIAEPKGKAIYVKLTPEGVRKAEELFKKHFQS